MRLILLCSYQISFSCFHFSIAFGIPSREERGVTYFKLLPPCIRARKNNYLRALGYGLNKVNSFLTQIIQSVTLFFFLHSVRLLSTYYVPVTGIGSKQTSFLLTWSSELVIKMEGYVASGCVATVDWGEGGDICQEKWMTRRNPPWKDGEQSIPSRGSVSQCKVKY